MTLIASCAAQPGGSDRPLSGLGPPPSTRERNVCAARSLLIRLLADDDGQDLVEYALLAAFVGIAGWAALMAIDEAVGTTYSSWLDADSGVPGLWDPPEPAGLGS